MFVEALELRIEAIVKETIAATDAIEPKNMTTLPTVALMNARALDQIMKVIDGGVTDICKPKGRQRRPLSGDKFARSVRELRKFAADGTRVIETTGEPGDWDEFDEKVRELGEK